MPLIDLRGPTAAFAENKAATPETNGTFGVLSRGRRVVDQHLCELFAKRARALADPEITKHTPLIAASDRGWTGRWLACAGCA